MKKRILFVDDEPALLEIYQLMLRSLADQWELSFATSGPEALALMAKAPFDLVISDMRMAGMDGAQLLNEVLKRYPRTARIILSGHADQEAVAQCVGATHQFLMKPCNLAVLKATLTRVFTLDGWVADEKLKALVAQMRALPSLPSLYFRVLEALESPNASAEQIGEIIAMDLAMTAKILQLVNSAFFGIARQITHPTEAVQYLGVGTVRSLALSLHVFSCLDQAKLKNFSVAQLWRHSLATGQMARKIAQLERAEPAMADEAFVAGMLHDIGKLMLAANMPDSYCQALMLAAETPMPLTQAEMTVFGASHADVGAYLLGLWGLPVSIVEAIALHHSPSRSAIRYFAPLAAVHAANILEQEFSNVAKDGERPQLDSAYIAELGLYERVAPWREAVAEMSAAAEAQKAKLK
jgi:putative nucleotidyltransferase with HDIG domain